MAAWEDPTWEWYAPTTLQDADAGVYQDLYNTSPGGDRDSGHTAPIIRLRSFAGSAADHKEWRAEGEGPG